MNKYPSQTQDKFTVRFPDGMRDAVAERAEKNGRSINSEIVQIIQDSLNGAAVEQQATITIGNDQLERLITNLKSIEEQIEKQSKK
ncbi:Arc family DNA-binding protein [Xenorhabdus bovienii]|uniref:Arc family DNA-binding protein n=1 Tax=Xenorhabdus bovienii TaxID=40576 RepID=UPI0023B23FF9|nr:Arc family DNA-binding protein [Xenorhabdus bovienii]MDE9495693.1 Arc family DNA-binding protein [Xenorhabdus bovienii]MDE9504096.1 Arc family DNA-binding protein [Xenorhabdus bovienii]